MKKNTVIAVTGIVFILAVLGIYKFSTRNAKAPDNATSTASDFVKTGNLVFNNPGMKPNTWFLLYEASGSPALSRELKFDGQSKCGSNICPDGLTSGVRGTVTGTETDGVVLVSTVELVQAALTGQTVKLFYYDPLLDRVPGTNNLKCSRSGLVPVTRNIPTSTTPIKDTINLLLRGELSNEEKQAGATTEFPLPGFALTGTSLKNGVLILSFTDPQNKTSGGSCRAGILWFQIEATAKQFPGVTQVKFSPATLFQP